MLLSWKTGRTKLVETGTLNAARKKRVRHPAVSQLVARPNSAQRLASSETLEPRDLLPAVPFISEVHPSGSGNGTYAADWFEITNTGTTDPDFTGWKMDDDSNAIGTAVASRGVTTIPSGKSEVFFECNATGTTDATGRSRLVELRSRLTLRHPGTDTDHSAGKQRARSGSFRRDLQPRYRRALCCWSWQHIDRASVEDRITHRLDDAVHGQLVHKARRPMTRKD